MADAIESALDNEEIGLLKRHKNAPTSVNYAPTSVNSDSALPSTPPAPRLPGSPVFCHALANGSVR